LGSEDPWEVTFRPAKPVLEAIVEMGKSLVWLDQRRRSRRPLFERERAAELIDLVPSGTRIAKAGALFLEAEEISAPEGWVPNVSARLALHFDHWAIPCGIPLHRKGGCSRRCWRRSLNLRTGEGRKRAMANGIKFGRKPKLSTYQRTEAIKRRAAGETLAEIAKSYAVDVSMISRL
jgi:hypothetical protein